MKFKKEKNTNNEKFVRSRIYFNTNLKTGKKTFEAGFLQLGRTTFWCWRTNQIYNDWPKCG